MNAFDLWGNPVKRSATYYVYHDENIPNKKWLLIGLRATQLALVGNSHRETKHEPVRYIVRWCYGTDVFLELCKGKIPKAS